MTPCVLTCSKSGAIWPSCNDIGLFPFSIVEPAALDDFGHIAGAYGEIAEMFTRQTVARVMTEHALQGDDDGVLADILEIHLVQPLPMEAAAEIEVVFAGRASRQRDLADIRPRAAIRTSAHADRDRLALEAVPREDRLDLADEVRQITFGLRHGEPA